MPTLAIGPANYAGQAHLWAAAAARHLDIIAYSFSFRTRPFRIGPGPAFSFPTDRAFPHPRTLTTVGRRLRMRAIARSSHVILDGFVPLGRPVGNGIDSDIEYLQSKSTTVGLISHGSDLRHPDRHRDLFEHSYFNLADNAWNEAMRTLVERNERTLRAFPELPLFVSTPDQLLLYPQAAWLPLCVGAELFEAGPPPPLRRRVPVVLHIPSRRTPPIKGSHVIDPVLKSLASRGVVKYVSPAGVSHAKMMQLMSSADVVIDQLLVGAYGATSVEAMALGRVVVCAVSEQVRAALPDNPPIISATPETFEAQLLEILSERTQHEAIAAQGKEYAKAWHDGRAAAAALGAFVAG